MSTHHSRHRYVVIGAGAVGAVLAAQFQLAGIETVLVARGANRDAITSFGLKVRRPHGTDSVRLDVVGGPDELTLTARDVLVVATKTQDTEAVLRGLAYLPVPAEEQGQDPLLGADLPLLTLQNGVATEDLALRRFAAVYGVSVGIAASHLQPGEVVSPSWPVVGVLWIGRYPDQPADPAAETFAADLRLAGWDTRIVPDISAWKARKLLVNLRNGLDVLNGPDDRREAALAALTVEANAVYAAAGIRLPVEPFSSGLVVEAVPDHEPGRLSTWQSFARGTSSETDYLNGEIVLLGRRSGVPTPVNERLQRLLGAQAEAGLPPGTHTPDELLDDRLARHPMTTLSAVVDLADIADVTEPARLAAAADRSGSLPAGRPLAVVRARSVDDVRRTLAAATGHGLAVVTRGAGSGLAGAATAGAGSVVLDLSGLDRIIEIDPVNGLARVEPGVITADLDRAAAEHGLFYPPDPGSVEISTVGGNIATNAGGLRGARYGVTRDAVLALDVVLPDGRPLHLGRDTVKGVVGLDLVSLLVGSEGALGVVVGATLRLLPRPVGIATAAAFFDSLAAAAAASVELATAGVRPTVVELVDGATLRAIDALRGTSLAERGEAFLLVQTDGYGAQAEIDAVAEVLARTASSVRTTQDPQVAAELTAARRDALPAIEARATAVSGRVLIEDIAVPRSRLPEAIERVHVIAARHQVETYVFAHAADGNVHPIIVVPDSRIEDPVPVAAHAAADDIFALALELGGTISAEHGVGVLKQDWARRELDPVSLELQRRIKDLFDPAGILNPGKEL